MTSKKVLLAALIGFVVLAPRPASAGMAEGIAAFQARDYQAALREFEPLAEQGNATAQLYLAMMYEFGEGVPKNYGEAVKWYQRAGRPDRAAYLQIKMEMLRRESLKREHDADPCRDFPRGCPIPP